MDVGIDVYCTDFYGVGGKIKSKPEDFVVAETSPEGECIFPDMLKGELKGGAGRYLVFWLLKVNWDTLKVVRELARRLRISKKRIGFAGMKDTNALTVQRMSIRDIDYKKLMKIRIKDIKVGNLRYSEKPVKLGDLLGNRFKVKIREVETVPDKKFDYPILNFYGIQRFGEIRPISHIIGRHIVKKEYKNAVMCYLSEIFEREREEIKEARRAVKKSFEDAIELFPKGFVYERAMLQTLINGGSYRDSLLSLPSRLISLFIHAYQSYLFNKMLSLRFKMNLPVESAVSGDLVTLRGENCPVKVLKAWEVKKINRWIKKGKVRVVFPLIGSKSKFPADEPGEVVNKVLENEEINKEDFISCATFSSKGSYRGVSFRVKDLNIEREKNSLKLSFFIEKGSYATVFLREFMKS